MREQSQESDAIQPAFWDLYARKVWFSLKGDKKAAYGIEVHRHTTLCGPER